MMGDALAKTGRQAEAMACYNRALGIYDKEHGPGHPDSELSLERLALEHSWLSEWKEAAEYLERIVKIHGASTCAKHLIDS